MKAMHARLMRLEGDGIRPLFTLQPLFILDDLASDDDGIIAEDLSIRGLQVQRAGQEPHTFWRQPGESLTELRLRGATELGVRWPLFEIAIEVREPR